MSCEVTDVFDNVCGVSFFVQVGSGWAVHRYDRGCITAVRYG